MRTTTFLSLALCAAVVGVGCVPVEEGQAFIQGVIPVVGPECVANAQGNNFDPFGALDIGTNANDANDLVIALKVLTNLPSTFNSTTAQADTQKSPSFTNYGNVDTNVITFQQSEVFFSTDEDRADQLQLGQVDGTPVNANSVRLTGVAGTVFNEQTQLLGEGAVFATGITRADAVLLQAEPFVANAIAAGGTARIIVNLRLIGQTTGSSRIETPPFPFPVQLCAGCLEIADLACVDAQGNDVDPIPNPDQCIPGNDVPNLACP